MQFWQAINETLQPRAIRMRFAVPAHIVFVSSEPEIRTQVHNSLGEGGELVDAAHGAAVWQTQEQHVHLVECIGTHELQRRATPQIGMREMDKLSVETLAGDLPDLKARMGKQQSQ